MRVCFLTHYFPPEVGAPQTRIDLLARALAARGAEVIVHTGFPHYPAGAVLAPYRNRLWQREQRDGISIVRSAVYPGANTGFVRRLGDHTAFAGSALATAGITGPVDVVVGETPPLFTSAAGVSYATGKRAAYVVNVADRWPESAVQMGALRNRRVIAAASALERFVYRHADLITAPTNGIVTALQGLPSAADRVRRVWPVVDLERFDPTPSAPEPDSPLRALYAGTLGLAQGLDVLIRASKLVGPDVVQTTIAGDGADADRLRSLVRTEGITNVRLLGPVPASRIPALYQAASVAVVMLRDLPIFVGALPTKLLEAMAAGRTVLLAARGESAELVRRSGAGLVVDPGSVDAVAAALRHLHAESSLTRTGGRAGRAYAEAHFGAARAADSWSAALNDAVRANRRPTAGGARRYEPTAAARCPTDRV